MKQDDTLVVNDKQAMTALKKHGGNIVLVIVVVLAGFFGWQFYQKNYAKIDTVAADSYVAIANEQESLTLLAQNPDAKAQFDSEKDKLFAQIDTLVTAHGDSVYAWQALMTKAFYQAESEDYKNASETLIKATQVPLEDKGLLAISRLQLAEVQLANGDVEAALSTIGSDFPEAFESSRLEVLGDVYVAKKDNDNAKQAYEKAWALLSKRQENRALLKLKMQALGLEPADIEGKAAIVAQMPVDHAPNEALTVIQETP